MEMIVALFQRVEEVTEGNDFNVAGFFEARDPAGESLGLADCECCVRTERGIHAEAGAGGCINGAMMREVVARIIGGTDGADFELAKDALRGEIVRGLKLLVSAIPDGGRARLVEQSVDAEVTL